MINVLCVNSLAANPANTGSSNLFPKKKDFDRGIITCVNKRTKNNKEKNYGQTLFKNPLFRLLLCKITYVKWSQYRKRRSEV